MSIKPLLLWVFYIDFFPPNNVEILFKGLWNPYRAVHAHFVSICQGVFFNHAFPFGDGFFFFPGKVKSGSLIPIMWQ